MSEDSLNLMRAVSTVLAMLAFLAIAAWAWSRRRREEFDQRGPFAAGGRR
ncbi:MAG: hypothetical protein R3E65_02480 [Steroidobacteraceae bacterium]